MEGKQILDASLITNEAINSLLKRSAGDVICKLDIEKAYAHANWNFLFLVLNKMALVTYQNKKKRWVW